MGANNNLTEAQLKLITELFQERQKLVELLVGITADYDYWKEMANHYYLAHYMLSTAVYHYAPSRDKSHDEWVHKTIKHYRKHIGPDGEVKVFEPSCEACQKRKEHPITEPLGNAILENDKIGESLELRFYPEIMYEHKFPDDEPTEEQRAKPKPRKGCHIR